MSWAQKEQIRAYSKITVEQIPDTKLDIIIGEADIRTRRMALYEYDHYLPTGTQVSRDRIQLPEDFFVADGNFDGVVNKDDIEIYGCHIVDGFLRKEKLTVANFIPREGLIILSGAIPVKYLSIWLRCWVNPLGLTIGELANASSLVAAAMCYRQIHGKEGLEIAEKFEEQAKTIIRKSLSTFI